MFGYAPFGCAQGKLHKCRAPTAKMAAATESVGSGVRTAAESTEDRSPRKDGGVKPPLQKPRKDAGLKARRYMGTACRAPTGQAKGRAA